MYAQFNKFQRLFKNSQFHTADVCFPYTIQKQTDG